MDPGSVTRGLQLRVLEEDWERLHRHLFPGDGDEHGAALLCGQAGRDQQRLLVREVVLAEDGVDYIAGTRGYRHLTGEFVTRQLRRAKNAGLVYLAVHNHGGRYEVSFSDTDLESHERAYPTLLALNKRPVGGVVLAQEAIAADVWLPDGRRRKLDGATIVGTARRSISHERPLGDSPERYQRQSLLFGHAGQAQLSRAKVGVVGAGGVGMLLVQAMSRLGVGHLVVIDPDRVQPSNLPRLPEATRWDAMEPLDRPGVPAPIRKAARRLARHKVTVARRLARHAARNIQIEAIVGDVADDNIARGLLDCDFIFLAADTQLARDVVNQIAYQYLIPVLQVGSKVVLDNASGAVLDVFSVVRSVGFRPGCLRCNGLIDPAKLSEEALSSDEQRANQRYVDDPTVEAPSVFTLNALGVGWASNEFLHYFTGLGTGTPTFRILRNRPVGQRVPQLVTVEPDANPHCHVCSSGAGSALAMGDLADLPTRLGKSLRSTRWGLGRP
jgi:hypothetical protein